MEQNNIRETLFRNVSYSYIPKMDSKIGIENLQFIAELKTIEKAQSFKYLIAGFNILYIFVLCESRHRSLRLLKPLMLFLPLGTFTYGVYTSRLEIEKIITSLFQEEFDMYRKLGSSRTTNTKDSYGKFFDTFSNNKTYNFNPTVSETDKSNLFTHTKFLTEWLYEPVDDVFENKLYFLEDSATAIEKQLANTKNKNLFYGLRNKKI